MAYTQPRTTVYDENGNDYVPAGTDVTRSAGNYNISTDIGVNPDNAKQTLANMLSASKYSMGILREGTRNDIINNMQRRGIRSSGIQANTMGKSMAELARQETSGLSQTAVDVFNAQTNGTQASNTYNSQLLALERQRLADANAMAFANQQRRNDLIGAAGGFASTLLAPMIQKYLNPPSQGGAPSGSPMSVGNSPIKKYDAYANIINDRMGRGQIERY